MMGSMLYGFVFSYVLSFGMAFLLSTFITLPVKERSSGAKHCQMISGVKPSTYWLTMFTCNLINYVIPALCVIAVVEAFAVEAYVHGSNIWYTFTFTGQAGAKGIFRSFEDLQFQEVHR